jgi:hypothetical protein
MKVDRFGTLLYSIGEAAGYLAIPPSTLTTLGLRVRTATGWGADRQREADRYGGSTGTRR